VEEEFARSFELNDEVKVYAKLPGWFKIDTPLGSYNPDWAVLVEMDDCGREHFKALGTEVGFTVANNYETFSEKVSASWQSSGKKE